MKARLRGIRVGRSSVTDAAIGPNASVSHAEGNGRIIHYHGNRAVVLRPKDATNSVLPSSHEPCIGRDVVLRRLADLSGTVELNGPRGIGKTNLSRHVAHLTRENWDAVYYTDRADPVPDVLLGVLSCFFDWDWNADIPGPFQVITALANRRPLVLLDNSTFRREEVEQVANVVGSKAHVVYTSEDPQLAAEAVLVTIDGLEADSAVALAELRLSRTLDATESAELRQFAVSVDGHPLTFLRALLRARDGRITFDRLAAAAKTDPQLTEEDRYTIEVMRCFGGAAISLEELDAFCARNGIDTHVVIARLEREGLIERHSPRVSLREAPTADRVDHVILRDVLRHVGHRSSIVHGPLPPRLATVLRTHLIREDRLTVARAGVADSTEATLGALRTGAAVGLWPEVGRAALDLIPVFAHSGRPGAWEMSTRFAVDAASHLDRGADLARALQERAVYLAVMEGRNEAEPVFRHALDVAVAAGEWELVTVITSNLRAISTLQPLEPAALSDNAVWVRTLDHGERLLALIAGAAAIIADHRDHVLATQRTATLGGNGSRGSQPPSERHWWRRRWWRTYCLLIATVMLLRGLSRARRQKPIPAESSGPETSGGNDHAEV